MNSSATPRTPGAARRGSPSPRPGRHVERRRRLVGQDQARARRAAQWRSSRAAACRPRARAGYCRSRRSPSSMPTWRAACRPPVPRPGEREPCSRSVSVMKSPIRRTGFACARGSWKTTAISSSIVAQLAAAQAVARRGRRSGRCRPPRAPAGSSREIDRAVIDLPEPDSPTSPTASPARKRAADVVRAPCAVVPRRAAETSGRRPRERLPRSIGHSVGRRSSTSNHGALPLERRADPERGHVVVRAPHDLQAGGDAVVAVPGRHVQHRAAAGDVEHAASESTGSRTPAAGRRPRARGRRSRRRRPARGCRPSGQIERVVLLEQARRPARQRRASISIPAIDRAVPAGGALRTSAPNSSGVGGDQIAVRPPPAWRSSRRTRAAKWIATSRA